MVPVETYTSEKAGECILVTKERFHQVLFPANPPDRASVKKYVDQIIDTIIEEEPSILKYPPQYFLVRNLSYNDVSYFSRLLNQRFTHNPKSPIKLVFYRVANPDRFHYVLGITALNKTE